MEKEKDRLSDPVRCLSGVGPKIEARLEEKGIKSVEDLLWFLPLKYLDRSVVKPIEALTEGERASVVGRVTASRSLFFRHSRKKAYEAIVDDGTGTISIKWFQWVRDYLKKVCKKENLLMLSGTIGRFGDRIQMVHPEIVILDSENDIEDCKGVTPVYSEIDGVKQGTVRTLIRTALNDYGMCIRSVIPERVEKLLGLVSVHEAVSKTHFPDEACSSPQSRLALYNRLILEEYLLFQMALFIKREEAKRAKGIRFTTDGKVHKRFMKELPFELTVGAGKGEEGNRRRYAAGYAHEQAFAGRCGKRKDDLCRDGFMYSH